MDAQVAALSRTRRMQDWFDWEQLSKYNSIRIRPMRRSTASPSAASPPVHVDHTSSPAQKQQSRGAASSSARSERVRNRPNPSSNKRASEMGSAVQSDPKSTRISTGQPPMDISPQGPLLPIPIGLFPELDLAGLVPSASQLNSMAPPAALCLAQLQCQLGALGYASPPLHVAPQSASPQSRFVPEPRLATMPAPGGPLATALGASSRVVRRGASR
jgi:hypothetical protein